MIIESLIRLGRPMVEGGLPPAAILRQVSDVAEVGAKSFMARVFVVEVDRQGDKSNIAVLPVQQWGDYHDQSSKGKKQVFQQDVGRAVGAPFIIPRGNPLKPQGRYGVPSYLVYDKQFHSFFEDAGELEKFISGRLKKSVGIDLSSQEVEQIALQLHQAVNNMDKGSGEKMLGLIVLTLPGENEPYQLREEIPVGNDYLADLGPSVLHQGKHLVADLNRVKERFWEAKLAEGAEMGEREGPGAVCYFCGEEGRVVSSYCKAWSWFTTTWSCPLPSALKTGELVESIALCPGCYNALTYGANLFNKLTKQLDNWLVKEIFSPSATAAGKELTRKGSTPDAVYGCAYVLPVLDTFLEDEDDRNDFVAGVISMLGNGSGRNKVDMHLREITGFETILPAEMAGDNYRMTIIYYSGDSSRGDIHLRATIEDVLPSVARELTKITGITRQYALQVAESLYNELSDKYKYFLSSRYGSLPYLLTTAYGAPYTWRTIDVVLHRGELSRRAFLFNVADRMNELARKLPDSFQELCGEVIFYLTFNQLLLQYDKAIAIKTGNGGCNLMRDWRELCRLVAEAPADDLDLKDPEELGFAAGCLVRFFDWKYQKKSKEKGQEKKFLQHRVMIFGSSLTPEFIWKRALSRIDEYALKLNIELSNNFQQQVAVVLMEYSRLRDEVNRERDAFMAAFWAGYALAWTGKEKNGKGKNNS